MNSRQNYVLKMKTRLDEWNSQIDELEAQIKRAKIRAEQEKIDRVAALKQKAREARGKLDEIRNAQASAWEKLVSGTDKLWEDLQAALKESKQAFREGMQSNSTGS